MKKNLFIYKNKYNLNTAIITFISAIIFTYFTFFFILDNKKYFVINNQIENNFYIIPKDKEGEKIKYTDKRSINKIYKKNNMAKFDDINDIEYTIQLFSDIDFPNIERFINKLLFSKSQIIDPNEVYIFSISSEIGLDYFVTYKNFQSKIDALNFCKKLSFVKRCLIVNP